MRRAGPAIGGPLGLGSPTVGNGFAASDGRGSLRGDSANRVRATNDERPIVSQGYYALESTGPGKNVRRGQSEQPDHARVATHDDMRTAKVASDFNRAASAPLRRQNSGASFVPKSDARNGRESPANLPGQLSSPGTGQNVQRSSAGFYELSPAPLAAPSGARTAASSSLLGGSVSGSVAGPREGGWDSDDGEGGGGSVPSRDERDGDGEEQDAGVMRAIGLKGTGLPPARKAGYVAGTRRKSLPGDFDPAIGRVSGIAGSISTLRYVEPVDFAARKQPVPFEPAGPSTGRFLPEEAADRELAPPAPPELAEKLVALVEKAVAYKDRLAQEQAGRAAVEDRLRSVHGTVVASLRAEVRALEEAAMLGAEESAMGAKRALGIGWAGLGGPAGAQDYSDPLYDEASQQAEQILEARVASGRRRASLALLSARGSVVGGRGMERTPEQEDANRALQRAALSKKGLGGGIEADLGSQSLTARLQPDTTGLGLGPGGVNLQAARTVLAGRAARARAEARAVLTGGLADPQGADVALAACGAGVGVGVGVADDEVEAALAQLEVRGGVAMGYGQWLERERGRARATSGRGQGALPPTPPRAPSKPWAERHEALGYMAFLGSLAAHRAGYGMRRAWADTVSGRAFPFRASVAAISSHFGGTTAAVFALHRHAVLLFLALAAISACFSLHHWVFGSFRTGAGAGVSLSAPQAFLPSSYTPPESGMLAGQLVCLYGVATLLPLTWWITADRRAKAHTALTALAGNPSYTRAVLGAVDLRGYSTPKAAADAAYSAGDELTALLQDEVLTEVGAATGKELAAEVILRRCAGLFLYSGLLLWILFLTAQLMLGGSMLHKLIASAGVGQGTGVAWAEAVTPIGVTLLMWFVPRALVLIAGLEAWPSHEAYMTSLAARLWLAHTSVALLQVLGYLLVADPYLMRAPIVATLAPFPATLVDAEGLYQQLSARLILARPFFPSLDAGGTQCRMDAATAGLWRLLIAHFAATLLGSVSTPFTALVQFQCSSLCRAGLRAAGFAMLKQGGTVIEEGVGVATVKGMARSGYKPPEHNTVAAVAELAHFTTLGLAALLLSPLSAWLVAGLAVVGYTSNVAILWSCRARPRRHWPGSGRAASSCFYALFSLTCAIMGCVHLGVLTSTTLPSSCATAAKANAAAFGPVPSARGGDPFCTALNDTMPQFAALHGWSRTGYNAWETASPYFRAAKAIALVGTLPQQRRQLLTSSVGEEVGYWLDYECVPQCQAARALYVANHTGSEPTIASDVHSQAEWCIERCASATSVLPACPLQFTLFKYMDSVSGGIVGSVAPFNASFEYRWSEAYAPLDRSARLAPYGLAKDTASVMYGVNVTMPCTLACGAWVAWPSGAAALQGAFTASDSLVAALIWSTVTAPMVLWLALLACAVWALSARNSADVERGLGVERHAIVGAVMAGMQRNVAALQRRLRVYEQTALMDEKGGVMDSATGRR